MNNLGDIVCKNPLYCPGDAILCEIFMPSLCYICEEKIFTSDIVLCGIVFILYAINRLDSSDTVTKIHV